MSPSMMQFYGELTVLKLTGSHYGNKKYCKLTTPAAKKYCNILTIIVLQPPLLEKEGKVLRVSFVKNQSSGFTVYSVTQTVQLPAGRQAFKLY